MDRASQRLLLALAASLLLHLWFAYTADSAGVRRSQSMVAPPVSATLTLLPAQPAAANTVSTPPQAAPTAQNSVEPVSERAVTHGHKAPAQTPHSATAAAAAITTQARAAITARPPAAMATPVPTPWAPPADPTYYTARSLDVYPKAITPLELAAQWGSGSARATVLINEAGSVNEVRAVEAPAADIEQAMRELLLRTRFTPASKDGRVVKAQVLVQLEYGTRAQRSER